MYFALSPGYDKISCSFPLPEPIDVKVGNGNSFIKSVKINLAKYKTISKVNK